MSPPLVGVVGGLGPHLAVIRGRMRASSLVGGAVAWQDLGFVSVGTGQDNAGEPAPGHPPDRAADRAADRGAGDGAAARVAAEFGRAPLVWRVLMVGARGLVGCVGRLRVTGDVPAALRGTPLVVAVNHVGNFDPVVVVAAMRTRRLAPRLLATAGLFRAPVVGRVLRACGHIPVNRASASAADALHEAEAALAAGALVTLYPEGRIGLDPGMWPERGKTGLARLALRTGATVIPVAQWGAHEVVAYHGAGAMLSRLLGSVVRRPVLRVHFGAPVRLDDLSVDTPGAALRATERIMRAVTDGLETLRADAGELRLPRHIDPTRPLSAARVADPRHRDTPPARPHSKPTPQAGATPATTQAKAAEPKAAEPKAKAQAKAEAEQTEAEQAKEAATGASEHSGAGQQTGAPEPGRAASHEAPGDATRTDPRTEPR